MYADPISPYAYAPMVLLYFHHSQNNIYILSLSSQPTFVNNYMTTPPVQLSNNL